MVDNLLGLLEIDMVKNYITRVGGDLAVDVMKIMLEAGEPVTDEYIAGLLGVKVTVVRTVLNRLHFWGIVDYHREKDPDTGWYTYTWFIRKGRLKEALIEDIEEQRREVSQKLDELSSYMFFSCPEGHERVVFEVAVEYNFQCPICGKPLVEVNVEEEKEELRKRLSQIANIRSLLKDV